MSSTTAVEDPAPENRRERKRRVILDAAFEAFADRGFAATTVEEVAAAAGVSKPTIYSYFGSKDGLFREAVLDASAAASSTMGARLDRLGRGSEAGATVDQTLRSVARLLARFFLEPRSVTIRRLVFTEISRFPELFDETKQGTSRSYRDALADRLATLADEGALAIPEPTLAADQLLALVQTPLLNQTVLGTRPLPRAAVEEIVEQAVDLFRRGHRLTGDG